MDIEHKLGLLGLLPVESPEESREGKEGEESVRGKSEEGFRHGLLVLGMK